MKYWQSTKFLNKLQGIKETPEWKRLLNEREPEAQRRAEGYAVKRAAQRDYLSRLPYDQQQLEQQLNMLRRQLRQDPNNPRILEQIQAINQKLTDLRTNAALETNPSNQQIIDAISDAAAPIDRDELSDSDGGFTDDDDDEYDEL